MLELEVNVNQHSNDNKELDNAYAFQGKTDVLGQHCRIDIPVARLCGTKGARAGTDQRDSS